MVALASTGFYLLTANGSFKRRIRKLRREQIGTDEPIRIKVEVNEEGIYISQKGACTRYDWSTIASIDETDSAVYFNQHDGGLLAVRKRGFQSTESKTQFVQLAKNYVDSLGRLSHTDAKLQQQ